MTCDGCGCPIDLELKHLVLTERRAGSGELPPVLATVCRPFCFTLYLNKLGSAGFKAPTSSDPIDRTLADLRDLLARKRRAYGNSALDPIRVFSKAAPLDGLRVRIDDKLSRLARGEEAADDDDTVRDLAGYLVLYLAARGSA